VPPTAPMATMGGNGARGSRYQQPPGSAKVAAGAAPVTSRNRNARSPIAQVPLRISAMTYLPKDVEYFRVEERTYKVGVAKNWMR
jgi:hypothetical protein